MTGALIITAAATIAIDNMDREAWRAAVHGVTKSGHG